MTSSGTPAPTAGYGRVTKLLHWLTVTALAAQFTIGYTLDVSGGRGRGRGRGGDSGRGRGRGGDLDIFDDSLLTAHVALGLAILTMTLSGCGGAAGRACRPGRRPSLPSSAPSPTGPSGPSTACCS